MQLGIIGLPNSGKTTVFNALTGSNYETGAVTGGKMEILTAVVNVPDERVDRLSEIYQPKKTTYATVTYYDIGGLDKGISQGGLSGPLRNALAQSDGFVHVVRVFEDETVPHPYVDVDPARDVDIIDGEFMLSDLITVERRLERLQDELKKGSQTLDRRQNAFETELMRRLQAALEEETPLRDIQLGAEEHKLLRGYGLLSLKPVVLVFNLGEVYQDPTEILTYDHDNAIVIGLQGQLEAEIAQLEGEDRTMFLEEYAIQEPSAARVIKESYRLMNIHSFFTVGEDEVRAWSVRVGAKAPEAAGVIHTDLQRGFIRAEVMHYDEFIEVGSESAMKAAGKLHVEGKEYVVKDGDILHVRFNV
ncbi:MAG: redox-regulated ATPase YchF [Chloroflexi bacterium]|nr:redox-regulated ATPase YchF [Chloroflexota bacterium]